MANDRPRHLQTLDELRELWTGDPSVETKFVECAKNICAIAIPTNRKEIGEEFELQLNNLGLSCSKKAIAAAEEVSAHISRQEAFEARESGGCAPPYLVPAQPGDDEELARTDNVS